jgi:hypothetical protein
MLSFLSVPLQSYSFAIPKSGSLYFQDSITVPVTFSEGRQSKKVTITGSLVQSSIVTMMTSNIVVSILLSSSLQLLWSFVNSLQIISFVPLLNLRVPSNLYYVLSLINGPLQFKLVNSNPFTAKIFGVPQEANTTLWR